MLLSSGSRVLVGPGDGKYSSFAPFRSHDLEGERQAVLVEAHREHDCRAARQVVRALEGPVDPEARVLFPLTLAIRVSMGAAAHGMAGSSRASTPRKKSAISRRRNSRSRKARTYSSDVIFSEPSSRSRTSAPYASGSLSKRAGENPRTPAPRSAGTAP